MAFYGVTIERNTQGDVILTVLDKRNHPTSALNQAGNLLTKKYGEPYPFGVTYSAVEAANKTDARLEVERRRVAGMFPYLRPGRP